MYPWMNKPSNKLKLMTLVAMTLLGCSLAAGDTLRVRTLKYPSIRITDCRDAKVVFTIGTKSVAKGLSQVRDIQITGAEAFNAAEKHLAAGQTVKAIRQYNVALVGKSGWMVRLIRARRVLALDQAGLIDRAVTDWLWLVEQFDGTPEAFKLRPVNIAPKGSQANLAAMKSLEAAIAAKPAADAAYKQSLNGLLLSLYKREGRKADAARAAGNIVKTRQLPGETKAAKSQSDKLNAMEFLIGQGQAQQVLTAVRGKLLRDAYPRALVPKALLVLARAQMQLAANSTGTSRRKYLLAGGLDLMRLVAYYPASVYVGEALLEAGRVNQAMGNNWAASNAYRAAIKRNPDSPAAAAARAALKAITASKNN